MVFACNVEQKELNYNQELGYANNNRFPDNFLFYICVAYKNKRLALKTEFPPVINQTRSDKSKRF